MILRILKRLFQLFVLLLLLGILALWIMLDGPKALWYKVFPIVEYDNLKVVLEVDDELVIIRGTARCSITPSSGYSGGPNPARRRRWGGDATVVLKDGRALVIPYTATDWCYSGRGARGFMRKWWGKYKKADFDEHIPLEGHFPLLILDNGDNPKQIDLLLGPGYYMQPEPEIKLISSERWASKEGPETYPKLKWLTGGNGVKVQQNKWMGGLVTELNLSDIENNRLYRRILPDLKKAISGEYLPRYGGDLKFLVDVDPKRISFGVLFQNKKILLGKSQELFRMQLFNLGLFGPRRGAVIGRDSSCHLGNRNWRKGEGVNFSFLGKNPERLWKTESLFWDAERQKLLMGSYKCANTSRITNGYQANKKKVGRKGTRCLPSSLLNITC